MNVTDYWTLALTTACIAGALLLEHVAYGHIGRLFKQNRYAVGLVTELGFLLTWSAIRHITIDPIAAVSMLVAAGLAGLPLYIVLHREQRHDQHRWRTLIDQNRELASKLALIQITGASLRYSRTHNLLESIMFLRGSLHQDLHDMQLLTSQLEPLLSTILGTVPDGSESSDRV